MLLFERTPVKKMANRCEIVLHAKIMNIYVYVCTTITSVSTIPFLDCLSVFK